MQLYTYTYMKFTKLMLNLVTFACKHILKFHSLVKTYFYNDCDTSFCAALRNVNWISNPRPPDP